MAMVATPASFEEYHDSFGASPMSHFVLS
jgi:hypothetical protein